MTAAKSLPLAASRGWQPGRNCPAVAYRCTSDDPTLCKKRRAGDGDVGRQRPGLRDLRGDDTGWDKARSLGWQGGVLWWNVPKQDLVGRIQVMLEKKICGFRASWRK